MQAVFPSRRDMNMHAVRLPHPAELIRDEGTAARRNMKLKLIVHLQKNLPGEDLPRLPLDSQSQEILGIPVRKVCFHVAPGRNLAVLLEAAVRNCILQLRGIDSMSEFINRQQQAVLDGNI